MLAGPVPGQAVPGVLQGRGDLREHLLDGLPHAGYQDPLTHLGRHVQGHHLPFLASDGVGGRGGGVDRPLDVSIVDGGSFVL